MAARKIRIPESMRSLSTEYDFIMTLYRLQLDQELYWNWYHRNTTLRLSYLTKE